MEEFRLNYDVIDLRLHRLDSKSAPPAWLQAYCQEILDARRKGY